jgi:small subunit ribosomal protein S5
MAEYNKRRQRSKRENNKSNSIQVSDIEEKVVTIKRVSKKTTGGNAISFAALVVVGDRKGSVGTGYGKAKDVPTAIRKAIEKAKDKMVNVPLSGTSIPYDVSAKYGAAKVLLKPAPEGSGLIAGGTIRVVLELAGIKDITSKMLGSSNKVSNVRCTMKALKKLKP